MAKTAALAITAQLPVAPLASFAIAAENPRSIRPDVSIEALAKNLAANGQLSPVIVYEEKGKLRITCGGTRFLAARQAKLDGLAYDVQPKDRAIAAGLAEQEGHAPLHPADQAVAFADALSRDTVFAGDRESQIIRLANQVGRTTRFVEQRLSLAGLHPPILDALRADKISVHQAEAWANADVDRQGDLWRREGKSAIAHDARSIKNLIDKADVAETDRLAKFVGKAYAEAGGMVRQDLFEIAEPELPSWASRRKASKGHLDRKVVNKLAREKLATAKAKLEAEGWGQVEATMRASFSWYESPDKNIAKADRGKYLARVSINHEGRLSYDRGLKLQETVTEKKTPKSDDAARKRKDAERKVRIRRATLAAQLVGRSVGQVKGLALACVAAAIARAYFNFPDVYDLPFGVEAFGENALRTKVGLATDAARAVAAAAWLKRLKPNAKSLEAYFLGLTTAEVDDFFAVVVAGSMHIDAYNGPEPTAFKYLRAIAELAGGVDLAAHTTPKIAKELGDPELLDMVGLPPPPATGAIADAIKAKRGAKISAADICKLHPKKPPKTDTAKTMKKIAAKVKAAAHA